MWISVCDMPIITRGHHGEEFRLTLRYCQYYGHDSGKVSEVVTAIWDSINECFYEKETKLPIDERDIIEWWCE